jgi:hypothetical protein
MSPDIAIDSNQKAHIIYRAPFITPGTPDLFYTNNVTGSFNTWIPIGWTSVQYLPSIAVDGSDFVHITYKKFPVHGGELYYGNNIGGDFTFTTYDQMGSGWYPGSRYFVLGNSSSIFFTFYDWISGDTDIFFLSGSWHTVGTEEEQIINIPTRYILYQNYPNPFNPTTTIKYQIPELSFITLKVYDVLGDEVITLVNEEKPIGSYEVEFYGIGIVSGVYLYRIQAGSFVETKKMVLMK